MLSRRAMTLAIAACLASGCSSPTPPSMTERGPHRGVLLTLPGHSGFAELVTEAITAPAPASKAARNQLAVYFLADDKTSSLDPTPSAVSLDVIWPDSTPRQNLILSLNPKAKDASGAARFVSTPGDYDAALSGTMTVTLGDQTVTRPF
jgi:hypothetical protein